MLVTRIDSSTRTSLCCTGAARMSAQKKARGLPGMKEGPLVQMLDRQRVQQAARMRRDDVVYWYLIQ
jgi:hypothetical protein